MATNDFFEEQLPASKIKSSIVSKYFHKWSRVIIGQIRNTNGKLGYLDFFCGPGKYEDGSDSTPLLILQQALNDEYLKDNLVTLFNDIDKVNTDKLKTSIAAIPNIDALKNKPIILNTTVGEDIVAQMKNTNLIPSLIFIDPFGYKGLTLDLIGSVIKDWGCDCIFFFNYNRINAAITNPFMKNHVNALFGEEQADLLREKVKGMDPDSREKLVIDTFITSLKKIRGDHAWQYKFIQEGSGKTSHFLIFVCKHPLGYSLMKDTMADHSIKDDGVPLYAFPHDIEPMESSPVQLSLPLFEVKKISPINTLKEDLLKVFAGKEVIVKNIYFNHHLEKPYILANYKRALLELEQEGKIEANPKVRRKFAGKLTMGDNVKITFK